MVNRFEADQADDDVNTEENTEVPPAVDRAGMEEMVAPSATKAILQALAPYVGLIGVALVVSVGIIIYSAPSACQGVNHWCSSFWRKQWNRLVNPTNVNVAPPDVLEPTVLRVPENSLVGSNEVGLAQLTGGTCGERDVLGEGVLVRPPQGASGEGVVTCQPRKACGEGAETSQPRRACEEGDVACLPEGASGEGVETSQIQRGASREGVETCQPRRSCEEGDVARLPEGASGEGDVTSLPRGASGEGNVTRQPQRGASGEGSVARLIREFSGEGIVACPPHEASKEVVLTCLPRGASEEGDVARLPQRAIGEGAVARRSREVASGEDAVACLPRRAIGQGAVARQSQGAIGEGAVARQSQGAIGEGAVAREPRGAIGEGAVARTHRGARERDVEGPHRTDTWRDGPVAYPRRGRARGVGDRVLRPQVGIYAHQRSNETARGSSRRDMVQGTGTATGGEPEVETAQEDLRMVDLRFSDDLDDSGYEDTKF